MARTELEQLSELMELEMTKCRYAVTEAALQAQMAKHLSKAPRLISRYAATSMRQVWRPSSTSWKRRHSGANAAANG